MKRKSFAGLMLCVFLLILLVSCNAKPKLLTECGEEVISMMAEMIESEEYKSLYDLPDTYDEKINKLRGGNYSKSEAVYELFIPEEALFDTTVKEDAFSEDLYKYLCSSAYLSFTTRVNQASGVEIMTLSTVFSAQKSFVNEKVNVNKTYLYVFEKGCPIAVTFVADGDGAFRALGRFLINDTFVTDDEQSIKNSCEILGINGVTVKKQ